MESLLECCSCTYKDAIKNTTLVEKVITMPTGLYYQYHVPLNKTNLKMHSGGSRWIGHTHHALTNFLDGYKAFCIHLEQLSSSKEKSESHSKSIGFLKWISSRDILTMSLFLKDVLTILARARNFKKGDLLLLMYHSPVWILQWEYWSFCQQKMVHSCKKLREFDKIQKELTN